MFDFQRLSVYGKAKAYFQSVDEVLKRKPFDRTTRDQLHRASLSISLNIAESSSRFSYRDRKNFLVIARGSAFECVAILEIQKERRKIAGETFDKLSAQLEEISKMLFRMIENLEKWEMDKA